MACMPICLYCMHAHLLLLATPPRTPSAPLRPSLAALCTPKPVLTCPQGWSSYTRDRDTTALYTHYARRINLRPSMVAQYVRCFDGWTSWPACLLASLHVFLPVHACLLQVGLRPPLLTRYHACRHVTSRLGLEMIEEHTILEGRHRAWTLAGWACLLLDVTYCLHAGHVACLLELTAVVSY